MLFAEAATLDTVLANVGTVFSSFTGYVGDVAQIIVDNPIILIGFVIPFTFTIVGFVKSLF